MIQDLNAQLILPKNWKLSKMSKKNSIMQQFANVLSSIFNGKYYKYNMFLLMLNLLPTICFKNGGTVFFFPLFYHVFCKKTKQKKNLGSGENNTEVFKAKCFPTPG